jgi:hypothetical protein
MIDRAVIDRIEWMVDRTVIVKGRVVKWKKIVGRLGRQRLGGTGKAGSLT